MSNPVTSQEVELARKRIAVAPSTGQCVCCNEFVVSEAWVSEEQLFSLLAGDCGPAVS